MTTTLDVLTFNLNNPSRERAERQLDYLAARPESVLVLTETADSAGCALLADGFTRVARVRAKTAVKGLAISRMAFAELLQREPGVAVKMLPVLAMRLAQAETI